jgi:hypothetical protein
MQPLLAERSVLPPELDTHGLFVGSLRAFAYMLLVVTFLVWLGAFHATRVHTCGVQPSSE